MKPVIILNDTSHESHIGSKAVMNNMLKVMSKVGLERIASYTRREVIENLEYIMQEHSKEYIYIINGEGSLHDYEKNKHNFFSVFLAYMPPETKIVLTNTLWENMKYYGLRKHLNKIDLISVRETYSFDEMCLSCSPKKIQIVPDLVFYNQTYDKIGYCDSVNETVRQTYRKKANYFPLSAIHSGTYLEPKTLNYPSDMAFRGWLNTLDLLVTGRFHSICMAMVAQCPFVALKSNSHKIESLLRDAGVPELLIERQAEIEEKKEIAKELIGKTIPYVREAPRKILDFWGEIAKL